MRIKNIFNTKKILGLERRDIYLALLLFKYLFIKRDSHYSVGVLWHILNPLLMSAVLFWIFSYKFGSSIENFGFYILIGFTHYSYFQRATTSGVQQLLSNRNLILNSTTPKEVFLLSNFLNDTLLFIIELTVICSIIFFSGHKMSLSFFCYPFIASALAMLTLGMSMLMASLNVFFRDISYLWTIATRILFFACPIFYAVERFGRSFINDLLRINPLSQIIIMSRETILSGRIPPVENLFIVNITGIVVLVIGWGVFKLSEPYMDNHL